MNFGLGSIYLNLDTYTEAARIERVVSKRLKSTLNAQDYKVVNNIYLPSTGIISTTQIDHIVFSIYGIFVIETKSNQGWIFGKRTSKHWKQVLYRNKYTINNPLHQNYAHTCAVKNIVSDYLDIIPISLVVFPCADRVHINDSRHVGNLAYVINQIHSHKTKLYTHQQVAHMIRLVSGHSIKDKRIYFHHRNEIKMHYHAI